MFCCERAWISNASQLGGEMAILNNLRKLSSSKGISGCGFYWMSSGFVLFLRVSEMHGSIPRSQDASSSLLFSDCLKKREVGSLDEYSFSKPAEHAIPFPLRILFSLKPALKLFLFFFYFLPVAGLTAYFTSRWEQGSCSRTQTHAISLP